MIWFAGALLLLPSAFAVDRALGVQKNSSALMEVSTQGGVAWASSVTIARTLSKRERKPMFVCVANRSRSLDRVTITLNAERVRGRLSSSWISLSPFIGRGVETLLGIDPDQMAPGYYIFDSISRFRGSIPLFVQASELDYRLAEFEIRTLLPRPVDATELAFRQSETDTLKMLPKLESSKPGIAARVWRILGDRRVMELRRVDAIEAYKKSGALADNSFDRGISIIRLSLLDTSVQRFGIDEMLANIALEEPDTTIGKIIRGYLVSERLRFGSIITTEFTWFSNDAFLPSR